MSKVVEATVPYKGYKTYYKIVGEDKTDRPPLVMLHGGPGSNDFYSYELWMDELDVVREALGLDRIHLFGHSWGGMLAMMYALRCSDGLQSLIVAASPANINTWLLEARRLVDYLPADMQAALWKAEETGSYDDPAAQEASDEYDRQDARLRRDRRAPSPHGAHAAAFGHGRRGHGPGDEGEPGPHPRL